MTRDASFNDEASRDCRVVPSRPENLRTCPRWAATLPRSPRWVRSPSSAPSLLDTELAPPWAKVLSAMGSMQVKCYGSTTGFHPVSVGSTPIARTATVRSICVLHLKEEVGGSNPSRQTIYLAVAQLVERLTASHPLTVTCPHHTGVCTTLVAWMAEFDSRCGLRSCLGARGTGSCGPQSTLCTRTQAGALTDLSVVRRHRATRSLRAMTPHL